MTVKTPTKKPAKATTPSPSEKGVMEAGIRGTADGSSYVVIHRTKAKNAPYNPQISDQVTQKKLRENIQRTGGLIEPVIWNKQTGNIVSGHKRLAQEDIIKGNTDYTITVSMVDWPIEKEIEQNIALNNPALKGQYEIDLLDALLERPDVDLSHTGFDITTLELMHMDAGIDLPQWMIPPEERASAEEFEEMMGDVESAADEADDAEESQNTDEEIATIKQRKKEFAERQVFLGQGKTVSRLVFPTNETRVLLMKHLELDPDGEYIDGMVLLEALGLKEDALKVIESEKPEAVKKQDTREAERAAKPKATKKKPKGDTPEDE